MKEKLYTIAYMIIVAAVFTAGVTYAKLKTQDEIRLNQEVRFERVVLRVLGLGGGAAMAPAEVQDLYKRRITEKQVGGLTVYAGYADDKKTDLVGYAFPVGGMGLWSRIAGMLGLDKNLDKIIGLDFTRQGETPGLGARITESWFKQQFDGKSVAKEDSSGQYIHFVPSDVELGPHEVHGITGATITTKGVGAFLNKGIDEIRKAMGNAEK